MSKATPLRGLPPGSAWNEAMRRAAAISIAGFFVPNLLANFGVIPQLNQNFQFMPGVCGAAGVFSASIALFLGYFHKKMSQGALAAIAVLTLPYASTWFCFRFTHPTASNGLLRLIGPTLLAIICSYFALMRWHARLSNITVDCLTQEITGDQYGQPEDRWQLMAFWVFVGVGAVTILLKWSAIYHGR
jgi:hypothetical protein